MTGETVQVRDVPAADLSVIRARAAAANISLSSYLRKLIADDAAHPTMDEALDRIATRSPVEASDANIVELIAADRR